ncbi:MAG: hypothetical protein GJ680_19720 [Alteromonadaceae bacterium]|nr:hypothetical protein [Alteromonadaceae bacterium]
MMISRRFARQCFCLFALVFSVNVWSQSALQNITPQQIEQFKQLPPQQQRALAQQMGIDFNQIQQLLGANQATNSTQNTSVTSSIYPRGTEFDEFGNPLLQTNLIDEFLETEDDELKPFGYELFAGAPSTFAPTFDAPIPSNYILGPGDNLQLQLYGKENVQHLLVVDREGLASIPSLGPVTLAGLTFTEAKAFVTDLIKKI